MLAQSVAPHPTPNQTPSCGRTSPFAVFAEGWWARAPAAAGSCARGERPPNLRWALIPRLWRAGPAPVSRGSLPPHPASCLRARLGRVISCGTSRCSSRPSRRRFWGWPPDGQGSPPDRPRGSDPAAVAAGLRPGPSVGPGPVRLRRDGRRRHDDEIAGGCVGGTNQGEDDGMKDEQDRDETRDATINRWQRRLTSGRSPRPPSAPPRSRPPVERPRTVAEAADELGLSVYTIRAWVASRRIAHIRLGRAIRIPADELRRVIEAGTVPAERT